jgi:YfiH family protein
VGPGRDVSLHHWPEASELGAAVAVTTRHGGVSVSPYASLNLGLHVGDVPDRVIANRERAARAFRVDLGALVFAQQVHGARVTVVGAADRGRGVRCLEEAVAATDILVTTEPATVMVILVADCAPIALIDPEARVMAAVHAGWRGTAAGAVGRALDAMAELGGRNDRVVAFIGPTVDPGRYQVDEAVRRALTEATAPHALHPDVARPDGPGHWLVDLVAANRQQLDLAGVPPAQIIDGGTSTSDDDFFSDRAARPCGRFALMAQLRAS